MIKHLHVIALFLPVCMSAQSLDRSVVASSGSFVTNTNGGISLSSTIGEPIVTTENDPAFILTQGFQQPDTDILLQISTAATGGFESGVWPNPFEDQLNVWINRSKQSVLLVSVHDMAGRKVLADQTISAPQGSSNWNIQAADFSAGVYLIQIRTEQGELAAVHRVSKSH